MKTDIHRLEHSQIELVAQVPVEEFQPFVDAALKEFVLEAELPGFRKGKAPAQLVREKVGEFALYEHAAGDAVKKIFTDTVVQNNFDPIGKPDVEVVKLAPGNPFEFKALFFTMPEVKLPDYASIVKPLKSEHVDVAVGDDKVEEALHWLRKSRRTYGVVARPAQTGDRVTCDFSITEGEKEIEHGAQKDFVFTIGDTHVLPGFEEHMIGAALKERKTFSLDIPSDYWNKQIAGKTVTFDATVTKVEETKDPVLDDTFAKALGKFETMDALKANLREGLMHEEQEKEKQRFRLLILKHIDEKTQIDTPPLLIEREQDAMVNELRHAIEETGIEWNMYLGQISKTEENIRTEFAEQAKDRVRYALILDAIAKKESIKPTEEEIQEEANRALVRFKTPKEANDAIDASSLIAYTKNVLTNEKVSQFLEKIALE